MGVEHHTAGPSDGHLMVDHGVNHAVPIRTGLESRDAYDYVLLDSEALSTSAAVGRESWPVNESLFKEIRGWLTSSLSSADARKLADPFEVTFEKSFFSLGRPVVDYRVSRQLKKMKQDSAYKAMSASEKVFKDFQAKLLDLSKPLMAMLSAANMWAIPDLARTAKSAVRLWCGKVRIYGGRTFCA